MPGDKTSAGRSTPIDQARSTAKLSERVRRYVKDVRLEMSQVSWPTWNQVRSSTFVVLFFTFAMAVFVYVVDAIAVFLYRLVGGR